MTHAFHEAADIFPLMDKKRFAELVENIRAQGLLHPIVLYDGKILDGRNRYLACKKAKVEPRFVQHEGDPFAYVWGANGERRDLTLDQRFLIWREAADRSEAWRKQQQTIQDEANRKRSKATKTQPRTDGGEFASTGRATTCGTTRQPPQRTTAAKAAASKTNRGTVERMETLRKKRPDLADKVRQGEMKPTAAMREMKKDEVAVKVTELPKGKYRVLYADPPWQYNDERAALGAGDSTGGVDRASTAARNHYPTLSKAELCALDVQSLAPTDAVLFCWATFPLLLDALEVIKAWGFKYKTAFVWDKIRGSFGHYHKAEAELLLICTRGSCTPDVDKKENEIQRFERTGHSTKPEEFRSLIDRIYPHGPRVELFCRTAPPANWDAWGPETKSEKAA